MVELSISDLYEHIDRHELWGNSFVFDPNLLKWVELNELELFKRLGLSFKNSPEKFKKPKRVPAAKQSKVDPTQNIQEMETHYLDDYISVFQSQIDKLLENNLKLVDENINFKVKNTETKAEVEMLRFQTKLEVQKLTSENESLRDQLQDHIQMLETQRAELRELKAEYQDKLEEQHQKLTSIIKSQSELVDKNSDLSEHYHRKELQLKELGERYEEAKDEAAKLKSKLEANMAKREADLIAELEEFKTKYKTDIDKINQESVAQIEDIKAQNAERIKELEVKLELRERQLKNNTAGVKVVEKIVEKKVFDDQEMQKFKAEMEAQLAAKDKRIKELINKQKVIANKYKEDFSKAQSAFENYQSVIHQQKQKELALNENFEQVKSDLALERSKAQRLEQLMNQQDALNEIADEKVKVQDDFVAFKELGKLFEISNAKHWEIRSDVYKDTKFTLTQMRELIENDEIDGETFVKREGKWWKKAKEVHELFLELREREEKGEIRYYIERQSLRVPCGDKVEILTERSEFAGVCINLSTGGCLISVQDLNTNIFKESQEITIVFMSESLLFEFEIIGTIRNVDVRDKTLGIQFVDITDEEFDTIAFYIDSFADKLEQEAA